MVTGAVVRARAPLPVLVVVLVLRYRRCCRRPRSPRGLDPPRDQLQRPHGRACASSSSSTSPDARREVVIEQLERGVEDVLLHAPRFPRRALCGSCSLELAAIGTRRSPSASSRRLPGDELRGAALPDRRASPPSAAAPASSVCGMPGRTGSWRPNFARAGRWACHRQDAVDRIAALGDEGGVVEQRARSGGAWAHRPASMIRGQALFEIGSAPWTCHHRQPALGRAAPVAGGECR